MKAPSCRQGLPLWLPVGQLSSEKLSWLAAAASSLIGGEALNRPRLTLGYKAGCTPRPLRGKARNGRPILIAAIMLLAPSNKDRVLVLNRA